MDFATMLVFDSTCSKKKSIKGAFSDKHGPRFRQTWFIPTMYPNFGNIGHVSRFWIHCYFWPISRQGFSGIGKGLERKSAVFCAAFQVGLCITMPLLKQWEQNRTQLKSNTSNSLLRDWKKKRRSHRVNLSNCLRIFKFSTTRVGPTWLSRIERCFTPDGNSQWAVRVPSFQMLASCWLISLSAGYYSNFWFRALGFFTSDQFWSPNSGSKPGIWRSRVWYWWTLSIRLLTQSARCHSCGGWFVRVLKRMQARDVVVAKTQRKVGKHDV